MEVIAKEGHLLGVVLTEDEFVLLTALQGKANHIEVQKAFSNLKNFYGPDLPEKVEETEQDVESFRYSLWEQFEEIVKDM